MIRAMHDHSRQKELEDNLQLEIELKEEQIAEATKEAKDSVRSDISKELHDNINQLLGSSKLYLEMVKQGGENSDMYLSRSSEYTMEAIEEIRKLTKGLTIDFIKNLGLLRIY
jgi:signal transduction histidine kinase